MNQSRPDIDISIKKSQEVYSPKNQDRSVKMRFKRTRQTQDGLFYDCKY